MSGSTSSRNEMALSDNVKVLQYINIHTSDVTSVDFTANFTLITGSSDKTVRIWEWIPGSGYIEKPFSPLLGHKYGITCVRVSPQCSMLATASIDGRAILWNLHSGMKIHTMAQVKGDPIRVCRFAPDSTLLVTAGDNGAICIWDLIHRSLLKTIIHHEGTAQALAFTPDSQYLVSACSLEAILIWNRHDIIDTTTDSTCLPIAEVDNAIDLGVLCLDISNVVTADEDETLIKRYTLASSGNSELIKIWTITSRIMPKIQNSSVSISLTSIYSGHKFAVTCVKYNNSGTYLVSSSLDKTVKIWDTKGNCLANLHDHSRYVNCVALSKDSTVIASGSSGSNDKSVVIWDLYGNLSKDSKLNRSHNFLSGLLNSDRGVQEANVVRNAEEDEVCQLLEKIDILDAEVVSCCFFRNEILAAGLSDKLVRLYKVRNENFNLEEMSCSPLDGHTFIVKQVKFSNKGDILVSCSLDGCAYLWNYKTGDKIAAVPENYSSLKTVCFSPDDSTLLVAGDDEIATAWDCMNMQKLFTLEGHTDSISSACYSPDGLVIATVSLSGHFRLWKESINIHIQENAHDLGVQDCDFSQNLDPIPNQVVSDYQNYLLVTCGNDSLVKLWWMLLQKKDEINFKAIKVKLWKTLEGHGGDVVAVQFSPETGEILCSTGTDRQVRIWSTYSCVCLHVLDHDYFTNCISFSQNCSLLAVGCRDKTLWLWKLPQQLIFRTLVANKIKSKTKDIMEWTTKDVVKWLHDVGLDNIASVVQYTTLNGQKILTLPEDNICSGLDLDEVHAKQLKNEIKWLKQDNLQLQLKASKMEIPLEFLCPITHDVMLNPVICEDGFTYERKAITEWFLSGKYTSPMTNQTLTSTECKCNKELRNRIHEFLYDDV